MKPGVPLIFRLGRVTNGGEGATDVQLLPKLVSCIGRAGFGGSKLGGRYRGGAVSLLSLQSVYHILAQEFYVKSHPLQTDAV